MARTLEIIRKRHTAPAHSLTFASAGPTISGISWERAGWCYVTLFNPDVGGAARGIRLCRVDVVSSTLHTVRIFGLAQPYHSLSGITSDRNHLYFYAGKDTGTFVIIKDLMFIKMRKTGSNRIIREVFVGSISASSEGFDMTHDHVFHRRAQRPGALGVNDKVRAFHGSPGTVATIRQYDMGGEIVTKGVTMNKGRHSVGQWTLKNDGDLDRRTEQGGTIVETINPVLPGDNGPIEDVGPHLWIGSN